MGLFGGLFDKKVCCICGGEIGLLGNRKLEDGNLCKNCASQLSPWFSERRHSTVREIEEQLEYRMRNHDRVLAFVPTRRFGDRVCLFMDDNMQAFTVTGPNGLSRENPDIVDYDAYVSVKPEIREHRWEDHRAPDDHRPPRYKYDYDFYVTIYVNHPYFDDMQMRLNPFSIKQDDWNECMMYVQMTEDICEAMSGVRPDLSGYIRYPEPEFIPPHPVHAPHHPPMGTPVSGPTGFTAPRGPEPSHRSAPIPPQGHPVPQSRPMTQERPAPQPAPTSRPMSAPRPAQPAAPQGRPMTQERPAPQNRPSSGFSVQPSAPQGRPAGAQGTAPGGLGRQSAPRPENDHRGPGGPGGHQSGPVRR